MTVAWPCASYHGEHAHLRRKSKGKRGRSRSKIWRRRRRRNIPPSFMEDYRAKAKAKYYAQKAKDTVKNKTSGLLSSRESTFPATVHQERELDKKHQVQSTSLYETKKRSINPGYCCQSSSSSSSSTTTTTTVDLHHIVGCNHPRSMVCLDCTGILDEDMRIKLSTKPIQEAYKLLSSIFVKTTPSDARKLSQREAKIFEAEGRSISTRMLTYGEVTFWSFAHILMRVKSLNPHAKHFCDLGSGTGKAVLIASIAIGFQRGTSARAGTENIVIFIIILFLIITGEFFILGKNEVCKIRKWGHVQYQVVVITIDTIIIIIIINNNNNNNKDNCNRGIIFVVILELGRCNIVLISALIRTFSLVINDNSSFLGILFMEIWLYSYYQEYVCKLYCWISRRARYVEDSWLSVI